TAGATLGLLSVGWRLSLAALVRRGRELAFPRKFERHLLTNLDIGSDFDVGVRLSGEGSGLIGIGPGRSKLHALGCDCDEVLERIRQLGIDVDASGVGKGIDDVET